MEGNNRTEFSGMGLGCEDGGVGEATRMESDILSGSLAIYVHGTRSLKRSKIPRKLS
jgi:hypothetical protein